MVQVIQQDIQPQAISDSYSWWRVSLIGMGVGILWWAITYAGLHFVISPILCKSAVSIGSCSDPLGLSGNIASVLAGAVGLGVLVRERVFRPIIVALASGITLWGLSIWVDGLSLGEILLWSAILYGISYLLYSWISRYAISIPVMLAVACVVIIARIATVL